MSINTDLQINKFEKQIVDYYREYGTTRGQSPIITTISCYLSIYESLTQQELHKLTNYSTGSISTNINAMLSMGWIEKKIIKGKRKRIISYILSDTYYNLEKNGISIRIKYTEDLIKFLELKEFEATKYLERQNTKMLIENLKDIIIYLQKFKTILSKYKDFPLG